MKASELRIGNLVNYCNSVKQLDAELFLQLLKYTTPFEPIPLTEEWLLKFGFEKSESFCIGIEVYKLNEFSVIKNGNEFIFIYYDSMQELNICLRIIDFVHQLQNLYFALTN